MPAVSPYVSEGPHGRLGWASVVGTPGGNGCATGQMGADNVAGDSGDDQLFGGPANDVVRGGDGSDVVVGNFGDDVLLGGKGDDLITGDSPSPGPPQGPSQDVCNGQQGVDLAVEDTCEVQVQVEETGPLPQG